MLAQALLGIAGDAEVDRLRSGAPNHAVQRVGIGAGDLAACQDVGLAIEVHDFVAGAHEGHAWRAIDEGQVVSERREHSKLRRPEQGTGGQRDGALPDVLAPSPQVLTGVARIADGHAGPGEGLRVFLADDPVRSLGEGRAGEDARRLAGADGLPRELSRGNRLDHVELHGAGDVGAPNRIPIHRGVVPRRQIEGARHVYGEHGIERLAQGPAHRVQRLHVPEDESGGFGWRHGGRILARSQARLATVTSLAVSLNRKTGNGARKSASSVTIATQSAGSCWPASKIGLGPATRRYTSILGSGRRLNPSTNTMSAPVR